MTVYTARLQAATAALGAGVTTLAAPSVGAVGNDWGAGQ